MEKRNGSECMLQVSQNLFCWTERFKPSSTSTNDIAEIMETFIHLLVAEYEIGVCPCVHLSNATTLSVISYTLRAHCNHGG